PACAGPPIRAGFARLAPRTCMRFAENCGHFRLVVPARRAARRLAVFRRPEGREPQVTRGRRTGRACPRVGGDLSTLRQGLPDGGAALRRKPDGPGADVPPPGKSPDRAKDRNSRPWRESLR